MQQSPQHSETAIVPDNEPESSFLELPKREPIAAAQLSNGEPPTHIDSPEGAVAAAPIDNNWAKRYGAGLEQIALKFGQPIFELVMDVGAVNVAITIMQRRFQGNNELMHALQVMSTVLSKHTHFYSNSLGPDTLALVQQCKYEVEHSPPLIMVPEAKSRIILPS